MRAGISFTPHRIRKAIENTARPLVVAGDRVRPLTQGAGLITVDAAYKHLLEHRNRRELDAVWRVTVTCRSGYLGLGGGDRPARGIYLRDPGELVSVVICEG